MSAAALLVSDPPDGVIEPLPEPALVGPGGPAVDDRVDPGRDPVAVDGLDVLNPRRGVPAARVAGVSRPDRPRGGHGAARFGVRRTPAQSSTNWNASTFARMTAAVGSPERTV